MTEERKPPPRRPRDLSDDEVVEVPETERYPRIPPRPREPFAKLVQTPAEELREVLVIQRKMALQLDGFGQTMNRRFELFHEELALLRSTVVESHAPRIEKVEASLGQKAAKGGGILALVLLAAPMLADALPKYRWLFEAIAGAFQ